jgi:hypothetical protein
MNVNVYVIIFLCQISGKQHTNVLRWGMNIKWKNYFEDSNHMSDFLTLSCNLYIIEIALV